MPLPTPGIAWPPKTFGPLMDACAERQVWWEGDPTKLAGFYAGGNAGTVGGSGLMRRSKAAWRTFWGRPVPTANAPKRLHVPFAADIGRVSASTLFSEPPRFLDAAENSAVQDMLDAVANVPELHSGLLVAAESASMLSGVFGRIVWDNSVSDVAWIDFVDADRAVPTFRWGRLSEVSFWTELASDSDQIVLRHVEHHSPGRIEHALYQGTRDNLGRVIPLTEHPDTAGLDVDSELGFDTGAVGLTAAYFPNHRPNPEWRQNTTLRHLGRSDLSRDVLHLLDALDECWSSWMRDLELGKARIMVSERLLQVNGPGQGAGFDTDRAIFAPVGNAMKDGDMSDLVQAEQFAIRVAEHQQTADALTRRIVSRVGYSPLTFGLQDEAAVTATEVDAKERDTNATRASRIRLWSGLSGLVTALCQVQAHVFGGATPAEPVEVDWPDAHQQSQRQVAETAQLLSAAEAASTETLVKMVNPDWDQAAVDAEVDRIRDGRTATMVLPTEQDFPADPAAGALDLPEQQG